MKLGIVKISPVSSLCTKCSLHVASRAIRTCITK